MPAQRSRARLSTSNRFLNNPDERLNADLKHAIGSKAPVLTKAKLGAAAGEHTQFIAANRDRVRSYFQDPTVK